jgi:hypothetical protein
MRFLRTNTAVRVTVGPFFDKTDGVTPETNITVTSCKLTLMVDDANVPTLVLDTAPTASGGANDMVHVTGDDAGFYDLELAAADVNYVGRAMLAITDAAVHCPVFHEFMILPAVVYDSLVLGTDTLTVDVTQFNGTNGTFASGRPEVNTTHVASLNTIDDFLDSEIAAILAAVDTEVAAILALLDDARTEPAQGAPPVNPDHVTKVDYLYKWARNKKDNDGTNNNYYADDGTTIDHKQSTTFAAGTATVGEMITGA